MCDKSGLGRGRGSQSTRGICGARGGRAGARRSAARSAQEAHRDGAHMKIGGSAEECSPAFFVSLEHEAPQKKKRYLLVTLVTLPRYTFNNKAPVIRFMADVWSSTWTEARAKFRAAAHAAGASLECLRYDTTVPTAWSTQPLTIDVALLGDPTTATGFFLSKPISPICRTPPFPHI